MTQLTDREPDLESADLPAVVLGTLSPSRAADFKTCPLLYRFRCIDRLPSAPSPGATRGPRVHTVLAALFDSLGDQRQLDTARALLPDAWLRVRTEEPEVGQLFADDVDGSVFAEWMASASALIGNYFALEDPPRPEPESREQLVEVEVDGVRLRGYIDRLDVPPAGDIRVVDYK